MPAGRLPADLEENDDLKIRSRSPVTGLQHHSPDLPGLNHEGQFGDYEFSRLSMQDHWRAVTTTRYARCAIPSLARPGWTASSRSISSATVARQNKLNSYKEDNARETSAGARRAPLPIRPDTGSSTGNT
jgi:hypothetical protein